MQPAIVELGIDAGPEKDAEPCTAANLIDERLDGDVGKLGHVGEQHDVDRREIGRLHLVVLLARDANRMLGRRQGGDRRAQRKAGRFGARRRRAPFDDEHVERRAAVERDEPTIVARQTVGRIEHDLARLAARIEIGGKLEANVGRLRGIERDGLRPLIQTGRARQANGPFRPGTDGPELHVDGRRQARLGRQITRIGDPTVLRRRARRR